MCVGRKIEMGSSDGAKKQAVEELRRMKEAKERSEKVKEAIKEIPPVFRPRIKRGADIVKK